MIKLDVIKCLIFENDCAFSSRSKRNAFWYSITYGLKPINCTNRELSHVSCEPHFVAHEGIRIPIKVLMWQLAIYERGLIRKLHGRLSGITKVMIILTLVARRAIMFELSLMWSRKLSFTPMSTVNFYVTVLSFEKNLE